MGNARHVRVRLEIVDGRVQLRNTLACCHAHDSQVDIDGVNGVLLRRQVGGVCIDGALLNQKAGIVCIDGALLRQKVRVVRIDGALHR